MSGLLAIDFSVTCGHALVDETLAHVVLGLVWRRFLARELGFLLDPLWRVGQEVIRILRGHQSSAGQREGHAAGVDRDPAPAPLLGDVGGRARSTGRVEDEVTRVSGHQKAPFGSTCGSLYDVDLRVRPALYSADIGPSVRKHKSGKIVDKSHIT